MLAGMAQLSPHFARAELTRSQTAIRLGRPVVVAHGSQIETNLTRLCLSVLEPLRKHLRLIAPEATIHVSSGYRPEWLNRAIGGSGRSQHCQGLAADIVVPGHTPLDVCYGIEALHLPFDQLIHEFGGWCHVSVAAPNTTPRRQMLTARRDREGRVEYVLGLQEVDPAGGSRTGSAPTTEATA